MNKTKHLSEIASVFFKLGCLAFGGPAAHISMMEDEVVTKRKWISRQHFLDLVGATNLIPGPNSTEMTMHCGHERGGVLGLFVAGICFIFPAVTITAILAWFYVTYGSLPAVEPIIRGIQPAVLAIIASAILKLGKKAVKTIDLAVLGVIALTVTLFGVNEIIVLLSTGILGMLYFYFKNKNITTSFLAPLLLFTSTTTIAAQISIGKIFWIFLKVGALLYGSGYVLFAYLDAELVTNGWLTRQELIDAVVAGQLTPGPVLSTSTFIGFQLGGLSGAMVATVGMFLPSFIFVWILNPLISKMRSSQFLTYFLDCVNIGAVAVMLAVLITMGLETVTDWRSILIATLSFVAVFGFKKVNSIHLVLGGAILGYLLYLI